MKVELTPSEITNLMGINKIMNEALKIDCVNESIFLETESLSKIDFPVMFTAVAYYFIEYNIMQSPPVSYKFSESGGKIKLNATIYLPKEEKVTSYAVVDPIAIAFALFISAKLDNGIQEQSYIKQIIAQINHDVARKILKKHKAIPLNSNFVGPSILMIDDQIVSIATSTVFVLSQTLPKYSEGIDSCGLCGHLASCIGIYDTVNMDEKKSIYIYFMDENYNILFRFNPALLTTNKDKTISISNMTVALREHLNSDAKETRKLTNVENIIVSTKGDFGSIFIKNIMHSQKEFDKDFFCEMF